MGNKIFWIHFDLSKYPNGIKASQISKIFANFSGLYSTINNIHEFDKNPQFSKKDFTPVFVPKVRKGSYAIGIQLKPPSYDSPLTGDPFEMLESDVKSIIQIEDKDDKNFKKFVEKYPVPKDRVSILKHLKELQPYSENDIKITYTGINEDFEDSDFSVSFSRDKRIFLNNIIKSEKIDDIPHIEGEFIGFKKPLKTFWITSIEGKEVACRYEDDFFEKHELKDNNLYRVLGDYTETPGTKPIISEIIDIHWLGPKKKFQELIKEYKKEIQKINYKMIDDVKGVRKEFSLNTIYNALFFISKLISLYEKKYNSDFQLPMIFPGAFGSIELEWSEEEFDLQINIPKSIDSEISVYGCRDEDNEFYNRYLFNDEMEEFFQWLKK